MTVNPAAVEIGRQGAVAVIGLRSPPVNALSAALRDGIRQALDAVLAEPGVSAVVLVGTGRMFSGGADIAEFGKPRLGIPLGELCDRIEGAAKPVVAAIHGTALGGGLELALACHYRIADPAAKVGLPEVKLGILPGAGGTQRLPRVVGPERALAIITSGTPLEAPEAHEAGLLDALSEGADLRAEAVAFAERIVREGRPLTRIRDREDRLARGRGHPELFEAFRRANARKFRGFEAPEACIRAVQAACDLPFEEGLAFERARFAELVGGEQSAAQRYAFFAERQAARVPDLPADAPTLPVRGVGVVGAGTMGGGIAMAFLNAGLPVTLVEARPEALERGLDTLRRRYESTARRGGLSGEEVEGRLGLLTGTLDFAALAGCDLVIEAAFEDMAVKQDIFRRLDAVAGADAILATNTSYLDVDAIAAATQRPGRVLGLHFFSPAHIMRLLEIVRGARTEPAVLATALALARRIDKVPVVVGSAHGFVGNRMLAQRQREANRLVLEGAMPWDVDRVLYEFGLPMGPFAMSDLAGLDLGWTRETSRGETLKDMLCERDRRGQKTGAGFYDYDADRRATPSPVVERLILDWSERRGVVRQPIGEREILERLLYPMVNEGARILAEGRAARASDIDVVWLNGYGWPAYRGGPMHWADTVGLDRILDRLERYQGRLGPDFAPAPLLRRLALEGKGFRDP